MMSEATIKQTLKRVDRERSEISRKVRRDLDDMIDEGSITIKDAGEARQKLKKTMYPLLDGAP